MRSVVVAVLVMLALASPVAAQTPTPEPHVPYPGETAYANRTFDASGVRLIGIIRLSFAAIAFESEGAARDGMQASYDRWLANASDDGATATMQEASAPKLGDESVAMAGTISDSEDGLDVDVSVATLEVRIGAVVLGMVGGGLVADALPELVRIAELLIDRAGDSDNVNDWLPVLADMPTGFVVASETIHNP